MNNSGVTMWEQRWHPLREEWVIIAAHRQDRPWHGERVGGIRPRAPEYVEDCYFCPGNARVSGARNPRYRDVFVFDNDHPCVGPDAPPSSTRRRASTGTRPATGLARVVCYSPRHNVTLAELDVAEIDSVLATWREQYVELGAQARGAPRARSSRTRARWSASPTRIRTARSTRPTSCSRRSRPRPIAARRYLRRARARAVSGHHRVGTRRTAAASSPRTPPPSRSSRTSRATRTSATWRRRRRTPSLADLTDGERARPSRRR